MADSRSHSRVISNISHVVVAVSNGGAENRPIRKIVPKGKKENAPIFQNDKKSNRKIVPKLKNSKKLERKIIPKWIVLSQNSHFIWEKSRCLHEQFGGIFYMLLLFQIFFAMFVGSALFLNWSFVNPVENTKTIHTRISRSSTRIIFEIFLRFMNVFDVYSQMMKMRKWLSTRVTLYLLC